MRSPSWKINTAKRNKKTPYWFRLPKNLREGSGCDSEGRIWFAKKSEANQSVKKWKSIYRNPSESVTILKGDARDQYLRDKELIDEYTTDLNKSLYEILEAGKSKIQIIKHYKTVNEVVDKLIRIKDVKVAKEKMQPKSRNDLNSFLRNFFVAYQGFGEKLISDIDSDMLDDWWYDESVKDHRTYHRYVNQLFYFALSREYVTKNPLWKWEDGDDEAIEINTFTPEQGRILLEGAPPELLPVYILNGWCGIRKSEISRLNWDDHVDFDEREIEVPKAFSKTQTRRFCYMEDNVFNWLIQFKDNTGKIWPKNYSKIWDQNRKDLGLYDCWGRNPLRHSCGTYHVAFKKDKGATQYMMGHADSKMLDNHYNKGAKSSEGIAWFNINPPSSGIIVASDDQELVSNR